MSERRDVNSFAGGLCIAVLVGVVLIGCKERPDTALKVAAPSEQKLYFMVDAETGCQYVKGGGISGLTPRLGKDGLPMCGDVIE